MLPAHNPDRFFLTSPLAVGQLEKVDLIASQRLAEASHSDFLVVTPISQRAAQIGGQVVESIRNRVGEVHDISLIVELVVERQCEVWGFVRLSPKFLALVVADLRSIPYPPDSSLFVAHHRKHARLHPIVE